jgi:hypothetical protein
VVTSDHSQQRFDTEAGAKTAKAVDKKFADGVGEKEVLIASENAKQKPKI